MSDTGDLLALCRTVNPATWERGDVPATAGKTIGILHRGERTPHDRMLNAHGDRHSIWRLVCASNTARGATNLAADYVDAIDGTMHGPGPWLVEYVSTPLYDVTDASDPSWSCTVEVHHYARS